MNDRPMRTIRLQSPNDLEEWRAAARALLLAGTPPDEVRWADPALPPDLLGDPATRPAVVGRKAGVVPKRFLALAAAAICHADPGRFALLYSLLWRLQKDRTLIGNRDDPEVGKLYRRAEAVLAEARRMQDGLRFRRAVAADGHKEIAAWFEPSHYVLERVAPHFVREHGREEWSIATPYRTAFWDGKRLSYGPGGRRPGGPAGGFSGEGARNPGVAPVIEAGAGAESAREAEMVLRNDGVTAAGEIVSFADARAAAQACRRCPLYRDATQAVFGEGPERADIMFVGEVPGDQEDLKGRPFIGPAGRVLDEALEKVGIEREKVYVTNAVKHFKFQLRGKKRLHQRPDAGEIEACRFWLDLEREFVRPRLIVALGATAAQSLLARPATIGKLRGKPIALEDGTSLYVTIHPSYLLRLREAGDVAAEQERFEADLVAIKVLAERLCRGGAAGDAQGGEGSVVLDTQSPHT